MLISISFASTVWVFCCCFFLFHFFSVPSLFNFLCFFFLSFGKSQSIGPFITLLFARHYLKVVGSLGFGEPGCSGPQGCLLPAPLV